MPKDSPSLTPEMLLHGYSVGIFPMAEHKNDDEVFWVDPKRRGVLPLDGFHMSRSLARFMRRSHWTLSVNSDFEGVLEGCADRPDTWISADIMQAYIGLHDLGFAHSIEIHDEGQLVGGIYGVTLGGVFFGESMFSRATNGSKVAIAACVDRLCRGGFALFDTQFLTAHLASLGGVEVSRAQFRSALAESLKLDRDFAAPPPVTLPDIVERLTAH